MKFSTKARYGLRAMLELAMNTEQGPIPVRVISQRQCISEPYLEQLMAQLNKAGLVRSQRGAQGGYVLASRGQDISIGEIIRVLEGPIAPVQCVNKTTPYTCNRSGQCVSRIVWEKVRDSVDEVLDSLTLADLIAESKKVTTPFKAGMFHI